MKSAFEIAVYRYDDTAVALCYRAAWIIQSATLLEEFRAGAVVHAAVRVGRGGSIILHAEVARQFAEYVPLAHTTVGSFSPTLVSDVVLPDVGIEIGSPPVE